MKKQKKLPIFLFIILFSILYLPFLNTIPHLDGNIDFVQSYHFFEGGFREYFQNWYSVHPPLKVFVSSLFFKLLGVRPISYTLIGYLIGLIAILYFYKLSFRLFGEKSAVFAGLFLTTSPLFLATAIFSLRDFLLTSFLILSLYFYLSSNYLFYLFFSSLVFLSKEAGLLLLVSVTFVEFLNFLKNKKISKFLITLISFFVPFLWWYFLKVNQKTSWRDWIFSDYASRGTYYVIIKNLLELKIFNKYAFQHWLHLFVLNFNWVFWLIFFIGEGYLLFKKIKKVNLSLKNFDQKKKTILAICFFILGYFLTVLCLQTYTIPRYVLPVLVFVYLFDAYILEIFFADKNKLIIFLFQLGIGVLIFLSLFFSLDPISLKIWGKTKIFGRPFYAINEYLAGNDGITYNFQYLWLIKKRTKKIIVANKEKNSVISEDCYWIFPDPRNDFQTVNILKLEGIDPEIPCKVK